MSHGDILTEGSTSSGIFASTFGQVNDLAISAAITAGNYGIYAAGQAGNLVVNYGTIEGCDCAGVLLVSNGTNTLDNRGSIIAEPGGMAIESVGDDQLDRQLRRHHRQCFDVRHARPTNSTTMPARCSTPAISCMAGEVTNDGTLAPGGRGAVLETVLGDNFVQGASGVFAVDLDPAAISDRNDHLIVSDTATLAGNVAVSMLSLPTVAADSYIILITATGGAGSLIPAGLGLIASPAAARHAAPSTATIWSSAFAIDFTADGLNPNQRAIAANLDQIYYKRRRHARSGPARPAQRRQPRRIQGRARPAVARDLLQRRDRRAVCQLRLFQQPAELQGQRHRHRLDHPRRAVPVGGRQRAFPRQRHDLRSDRL